MGEVDLKALEFRVRWLQALLHLLFGRMAIDAGYAIIGYAILAIATFDVIKLGSEMGKELAEKIRPLIEE